jgi:two-component system, NtrC family, nitrogen regulation sensor histidine kinase NtrY
MASEQLLHSRLRYLLVFALVALSAIAGYLLALQQYLPALLLFLLGLSAFGLFINMVNHTNRTLAYFFNSLYNNDTTLQFPVTNRNKSLNELYKSMNQLNKHYQSIKIQNEYNEKYYKTLIRHAATGLLVVNADNSVELMNKVACRYAGISPDSTNSNLLKIRNPLFFEAICSLRPGEDITYKHVMGNSFQLLSFRATLLKKNDNMVKLVSIQDIRHELESRELESYRKLISVLTHEIMNLMSPLTSVSKVLYELYHHDDKPIKPAQVDENIFRSTLSGLQVIDEQTNGILNFVDNYRKISRLPQPVIKPVDVDEWIEQLRIVYSGKMSQHQVEFEINYDRVQKQIPADKNLLNQVIINLINNAFDAVMEIEGTRKISMEVLTTPLNRTLIKITNNGPMIPPELQEKIFVPFFTTKKNGSGIGLSISQEIIKLHKGSLMVVSTEEGKTSFLAEI